MKHCRIIIGSVAICAMATGFDVDAQSDDAAVLLRQIDHLVYATPDLSAGVERIEALLGVRATPGGQHPGEGTRNALIALGPTSYLEILAPDPEQPKPDRPRRFGIDTLSGPRLVTWAAKGRNLTQTVDVGIGELANAKRRIDVRLLDNVARVAASDTVDVRQADLDLLVAREIDARNSSHYAQP